MVVVLDNGSIGYVGPGFDIGDVVDVLTENSYGKPIIISGAIREIIEENE